MNTHADLPPPVKRQYRVPAAGWTYITVVSLLGIGSINSQNNLLFFLFGLALGAILVSGIISGSIMMGVRLQRLPTNNARAGETARIRYRVRNANRFVPLFAISITERALAPKSTKGLLPADQPPPRFLGLFASKLPDKKPRPHALLPHLRAKRSIELTTPFTPRRRGRLTLDRIRVTTTFPLGLVEKTIVFQQPQTITIQPRVLELERGALDIAVNDPRPADRSTNNAGVGLEFYALREYTPGDSPRHISWRASARLGTLLTRQTEADHDKALLLDLRIDPQSDALRPQRNSTRDPLVPIEADDEDAIALAASLAAAAARRGNRLGLRCDAAAIDIPPTANPRQLHAVLDALATLAAPNHNADHNAHYDDRPHRRRPTRTPAGTVTIDATPHPAPNALTPPDLHRLAACESRPRTTDDAAAATRRRRAAPTQPRAAARAGAQR